jgi:hypothetical protein
MAYGDAHIFAVVINDYNVKKATKCFSSLIKVSIYLSHDYTTEILGGNEKVRMELRSMLDKRTSIINNIVDCCERNRAVIAVANDFQPEPYNTFDKLLYCPMKVSDFLNTFKDIHGIDELSEFKNRYMILFPCHEDEMSGFYDQMGRTICED